MRGETFRRILTGRKRSLILWSVSLVLLMLLMALAYPAVRDQSSFSDMMDQYPDFVKQLLGLGTGLAITEPAGYLNSQVFANSLPIIFLIFLIGFAVRETAGEEREGLLDLQLAHPVSRERVMLEKAAAMLACAFWLGVVSAVSLMASGPLVDMNLSLDAYIGATLSTVLLACVFGMFALALGALTGSRAVSIGASSGIAIVLYIVWGLAPLISQLKVTNVFNPWFWALAGDPILHGIQGGNTLLLLGIVAGFVGLAVWGLRRRDLGV